MVTDERDRELGIMDMEGEGGRDCDGGVVVMMVKGNYNFWRRKGTVEEDKGEGHFVQKYKKLTEWKCSRKIGSYV